MSKILALMLSIFFLSTADIIPLEQTITIITVYQAKIDSLDVVIHKEQVNMLKDRIFQKCRATFFKETFEDQLSFIEQLKQYKDNTFILLTLNNFTRIKELEKEQLEFLLLCEPELSNDRAVIRLHIRKVIDQIHTINKMGMCIDTPTEIDPIKGFQLEKSAQKITFD